MLLRIAVALFLFLPLHDTLQDKENDGKYSYFKKLTQLYDKLGLSNGEELARRQILAGLLSDALNRDTRSPREERFIRDTEVTYISEENGSFEVRLLTDSLQQTSPQYELVRGTADFAGIVASVTSIRTLDPSLYKRRRVENTPFNNGSKGKEVPNDKVCRSE